jgi:hypothetical protein
MFFVIVGKQVLHGVGPTDVGVGMIGADVA